MRITCRSRVTSGANEFVRYSSHLTLRSASFFARSLPSFGTNFCRNLRSRLRSSRLSALSRQPRAASSASSQAPGSKLLGAEAKA